MSDSHVVGHGVGRRRVDESQRVLEVDEVGVLGRVADDEPEGLLVAYVRAAELHELQVERAEEGRDDRSALELLGRVWRRGLRGCRRLGAGRGGRRGRRARRVAQLPQLFARQEFVGEHLRVRQEVELALLVEYARSFWCY